MNDKTTIKAVEFFYPTSPNAKKFAMPQGGYVVTLFHPGIAKPEYLKAFADKAEAIKLADTLPYEYHKYSQR